MCVQISFKTIILNKNFTLIAHQCPSYQHFQSGKCFDCKPGSGSCALMGYHSDISPGLENEISPQVRLQGNIGNKFFTTTGREFPFCRKIFSHSMLSSCTIHFVHCQIDYIG